MAFSPHMMVDLVGHRTVTVSLSMKPMGSFNYNVRVNLIYNVLANITKTHTYLISCVVYRTLFHFFIADQNQCSMVNSNTAGNVYMYKCNKVNRHILKLI